MTEPMTYSGVGVDYDAMDPFKRKAQLAASKTAKNILRFGQFQEVELSRGESAYLIETPDYYLAHVEEGLGTKNLIADEMYRLTGGSFYDAIAHDTVAMIVNDMITLGALPLCTAMHLAVGDSEWFKDEKRSNDLIEGWKDACNLAGCTWGGGETPTLKGIVAPETFVISGSAMGIIKPKSRRFSFDKIRHGDAIVLFESSGIHANGLTMARKIAEKLPKGYLTFIGDGHTYGHALLARTINYVRLIEGCLNRGIDIHYAVNITGHGWRKLMRAPQNFAYVIEKLPKQLPLFDFMQQHGPVDAEEAYANFNMGAGFAVYVAEADVDAVLAIAASHYMGALRAGFIERSNEKKVIVDPRGLEYLGSTLGVR